MRLPIIGDLFDLRTDLIGTFERRREKDGPVASLRVGLTEVKLISDAELIEYLLIGKCAGKSKYTHMMSAAFGESLVIADGESWKRQRKYLQPHFTKRSLKNWSPYIKQETSSALARWSSNNSRQPVNIQQEANQLIQPIMGGILFGDLFPKHKASALMATAQGISEGLFATFLRNSILIGPLMNMPTPGRIRYKKHLRAFSDFINQLYEIEIPDNHASLAAAIIKSVDRTAEGKQEVKDQLSVLYFAGHDTTAKTLSWSFYFLCRHPNWVNTIRTDCKENDYGLMSSPSARAVIRETLRLRPPAYGIERQVNSDIEFGRYALKKETITPISVIDVHKAPEYWSAPQTFSPERFLSDTSQTQKKCAYIPFGHGPRKCIGMDLAMLELEHIIASVCANLEFSSPNHAEVRPNASLTLGMKPSLQLLFTAR